MSEPLPPKKRKLGELLVEAGLIKEPQLQSALNEQKKWGGRLGRTLVEMGFVREEAMLVTLAKQLNLPTVDLDRAELPAEVVQGLRLDQAERFGVFPVRYDPKRRLLTLATSDPTDLEQARQLTFHTGLKLSFVLAVSSGIDRAIRRHYYGEGSPKAEEGPQSLGAPEAIFTPTDIHRASQAELPAPDPLRNAERRIRQLESQLAELARTQSVLLEILLERGLVRRDNFLARVNKKKEEAG